MSVTRSKPGDPCRQGRVDRSPRPPAPSREAIEYKETSASVVAYLGVIDVAEITANPNGGPHAFAWTIFLHPHRRTPRPALTMEKAKSAVEFAVRNWLEAACLAIARDRRDALKRERGGR
jgi:hypothetical protein